MSLLLILDISPTGLPVTGGLHRLSTYRPSPVLRATLECYSKKSALPGKGSAIVFLVPAAAAGVPGGSLVAATATAAAAGTVFTVFTHIHNDERDNSKQY